MTIIPRGRSLGVTQLLPEEDRLNISENELHARLVFILGGRAAEKLVFDEYSAGAENDLMQATKLARRMVTAWGMSERLGPVAYRTSEEHPFLGKEFHEQREFSEHTAQLIDEEVSRILHAAAAPGHRAAGPAPGQAPRRWPKPWSGKKCSTSTKSNSSSAPRSIAAPNSTAGRRSTSARAAPTIRTFSPSPPKANSANRTGASRLAAGFIPTASCRRRSRRIPAFSQRSAIVPCSRGSVHPGDQHSGIAQAWMRRGDFAAPAVPPPRPEKKLIRQTAACRRERDRPACSSRLACRASWLRPSRLFGVMTAHQDESLCFHQVAIGDSWQSPVRHDYRNRRSQLCRRHRRFQPAARRPPIRQVDPVRPADRPRAVGPIARRRAWQSQPSDEHGRLRPRG